MNDFDAAKLMADLQRGVQEMNQVIAKRVAPDSAALTLLNLTSEIYRWTDAEGSAHETDTFPTWQPAAGSRATAEAEVHESSIAAYIEGFHPTSSTWWDSNPTRNLIMWSMEVLRRCLLTTLDSLSGAAALLPSPGHSRAPIILSRSALEAGATVSSIVDPQLSSEERSRRLLNLRLAELHESALDEDQREEVAEMISFAEYLGFSVTRPKNRWVAPFVPGPTGRSDSSAQAIERALPSVGRDLWRDQSAVAHSRATAILLADEFAAPHEIDLGRQAESAALNLLPAVMVLTELLPAISAFTGWAPLDARLHVQRCFQAMSSCAGLNDRAIRQELGFANG